MAAKQLITPHSSLPTPNRPAPPLVVDVRYSEFDVYIGRRSPRAADPRCHHGSVWANPFVAMGEWSRGPCIEWYANLLRWRLEHGGVRPDGRWWSEEEWREAVLMLEGKRLGCWCKGKKGAGVCHGDVIVGVFEEMVSK